MTEEELKKTSKFISYVLRHYPESAGLVLDSNGWADIDALIAGAQRNGLNLDRSSLMHIVATNNKKRFAINETQTLIRASQGHSVVVELGLIPQAPPFILYHGTSTRFLDSILQQGLLKGNRLHVHLSADSATAKQVGMRHGKVVILEVAAGQMAKDGYVFYMSENSVWLTDQVDPGYLKII
ncbi:RNA 2'-phosphotransferase [Mucilaginibacter lacusdianchii]|uniref:RNA 2'-phosphotransferase n=1 Tax=Mucilaginibacter lacusdianchii TaxID=2684211 RepID=UPI00131E7A52|nr:RNA 2'-phosphotransferase [Mucilaginibacter sp. JXJ CY 39]